MLSTDYEDGLVEWGAGWPLFANSALAIGATMVVAFAEMVRGPAVGTLFVAAAGYRIQVVQTKALRVMSPEWKLIVAGYRGRSGAARAGDARRSGGGQRTEVAGS